MRKELETRTTLRDWIWFGLALAGVLVIGAAIGVLLAADRHWVPLISLNWWTVSGIMAAAYAKSADQF